MLADLVQQPACRRDLAALARVLAAFVPPASGAIPISDTAATRLL
jgi:hypothetical protein